MPEIQAPEPLEDLSATETHRLERLENAIENFRKSYYQAGAALAEIRDKRLYRATHPTFEAYLSDRWRMKRQRAYEIIDAWEITNNLSASSDVSSVADIESHLRTLRTLTPEDQVTVYSKAMGRSPEGKLTALILQETKQEFLAAKPVERATRPTNKKAIPGRVALTKAASHLQGLMGKQFTAMLQNTQHPSDVVAFSKLRDHEIKHAGKLIQQGWKYAEALKEALNSLNPSNLIRELHSRCLKAGGRLRIHIPPFVHVVITEDLEKELDSKLKDWPRTP